MSSTSLAAAGLTSHRFRSDNPRREITEIILQDFEKYGGKDELKLGLTVYKVKNKIVNSIVINTS